MRKFCYSILLLLVISLSIFSGCSGTIDLDKLSKKLSTYSMDILFDGDHTLTVTQSINYINDTGDSLDHVCLHVYVEDFSEDVVDSSVVSSLNFDKAYYLGKSYSNIVFNKILLDNKECNYSFIGNDSDILHIDIDNKLASGDNIDIYFEYVITLPNINHRFGIGENTINISNFYPIVSMYENGEFDHSGYHSNGDPFYSNMANYNVTITAPTKYTLASSGNVTKTTQNESNNVYKIKAKVIRDFAFILSDNFSVVSDTVNDTVVNYYYYKNSYPDKCLETIKKCITTFEDIIGDYPYKTLNVAEASFVHGGMEYPNLVYISDAVLDEEDYLNVIIHEVAHQWWYGLVGNDEYKYGWLDEGLTEYSTLLFYERNSEYGVDVDTLIKNQTNSYVTFIEVYSSVFESVDTSMNRELNEYGTEYEYVYIAYVKGMLFFDSLRELVGDKRFFVALKDYFNSNCFSIATPETLLNSFEKSTKLNLKDYFASWINGNVEIISIN